MNLFRVGFIWERAPCQVVRRAVKLALFSSKSICNLCLALEFRVHIWLCIPVSSLHSQLIGKLLGSSNPYKVSLVKIDLFLFLFVE